MKLPTVAFRVSPFVGLLFLLHFTVVVQGQVNYHAGQNLAAWTTTGDYSVDSHEWFGDTLIVSSTFRYVFDTIQRIQGDTIINVVRYGSAQGIHIYPNEYEPATINIVDTAFIPVTTPVRYKDKMYWGAQKSFTPPDTSAWIILYEFDPKTLERRTLTLHDAQSDFHYVHDLEVRGDLLSVITRAGVRGGRRYFMNIIDLTDWEIVTHIPLQWTTGSGSANSERLLTSSVQVYRGDTVVFYSGVESNSMSNSSMFFKLYNLQGQELSTEYIGNDFRNGAWLAFDVRKNFDRSILTLRSDSNMFFLTNHSHIEFSTDTTTTPDFKAYSINPVTFERLDSTDMGDPSFWNGMQALMDYTTVGDTLIAVGQCGDTNAELELPITDPRYNATLLQLGVVAYDMNSLEMLWQKRIIAATEFRELSEDYGVARSPHNFVSATAMTWSRNEFDNSLDNEVRIIHLNEHGCPSGDPDRTCDDLIWLDEFVSETDDPAGMAGVVPSLAIIPSLLKSGSNKRIRFSSSMLSQDVNTSYNVQLYDGAGRLIGKSEVINHELTYTLPTDLSAGIYYAYLRSVNGQSIGVGKFVLQ